MPQYFDTDCSSPFGGVLWKRIIVSSNFTNFTGKHLCWNLFLIQLQVFSRDTPTRVFPCEICEIFSNTFLEDHHQKAASVNKLPRNRKFSIPRLMLQMKTFYRSISLYAIRMRENTDQKKLRIWTHFTQWQLPCCIIVFWKNFQLNQTLYYICSAGRVHSYQKHI